MDIYQKSFRNYLRTGASMQTCEQKMFVIEDIFTEFRRELSSSGKWGTPHMIAHFYVGGGRTVTLEEMGTLESVKSFYIRNYLGRFLDQIRRKARSMPDGPIYDSFQNGYSFYGETFAHGRSAITGAFHGYIETLSNNRRTIYGTGDFEFLDTFTDPVNLRSSLHHYFDVPAESLSNTTWQLTEFFGTAYKVTGQWSLDLQFYLDE